MPIYEFHCEACERDSEILVRSANWRGTKCPHCGSAKLDKKFSTFASAVREQSLRLRKNLAALAAAAVDAVATELSSLVAADVSRL